MAAVATPQGTCCGCGGSLLGAGLASTSCRAEQQPAAAGASHDAWQTGAAEGAVEMDPTRRYIRYPVLLGRGACKRVYKAFDLQEGIEVAWNKTELSAHDLEPEQQERLFAEIRVLRTLHHRNIITCYEWWHDAPSQAINFITELFTSGTLRQYRKKHLRHISDTAIKRWAFQILEGLLYLHAHSPPILHRDLKCDNILVNGTSGQVKIADLGLASCQRGMSVVGTPEFMAPEMYDEVYDEKVDIYAFGMCMLELATLEYPYSECRSIPAIFMRVSKGIPPAALAKASSDSLRELITTCIAHDPAARPGALQLLKHAFFADLAERPSGSPTHHGHHPSGAGPSSRHASTFSPPFGSCGNLQALAHGSIGQHLSSTTAGHNGSSSRESRGPSGDGSSGGTSGTSSSAGGDCERDPSSSGSSSSSSVQGHTSMSGAAAVDVRQDGASGAAAKPRDGEALAAEEAIEAAAAAAAVAARVAPADRARFALPSDTDKAGPSSQSFPPGADLTSEAAAPSSSSSSSSTATAASPAAVAATAGSCGGPGGLRTAAAAGSSAAAARNAGAVAVAAAGGARGTTVCVAKIGRPVAVHDEEDSDEEVLVALEDVLVPHPEDFADAHALGLTTQLMHQGSGATIMSSPGYQLADGLSGLLDTLAAAAAAGTARPSDSDCPPGLLGGLGSSGLLSRFASNVTLLLQQQQQQLMQQQADRLQQQGADQGLMVQQQQQQQQQAAGGGERPHSASSGSGSRGPSLPSSRLGSVSGAAPAASILQGAGVCSGPILGGVVGSAGALPAGYSSSAAMTGAGRRSSSTATASGVASPILRPASASAAAATEATAAAAAAAAAAAQLLVRSASSLSSCGLGSSGSSCGAMLASSGQVAGALAAAGLLVLSPGCYVATPAALQKLLSKAAGPRGNTGSTTGSGIASSTAGGAAAITTAATPATGSDAVSDGHQQQRCCSLEAAPAAAAAPPAAAAAAAEAVCGGGVSSGQHGPLVAPAAPDTDAVAVITLQAAAGEARKGTDLTTTPPQLPSSMPAAAAAAGSRSMRATVDTVLPLDAAALAALSAPTLEADATPAAAPVPALDCAPAAAVAAHVAASGGSGAGFGRILVRRRFVKNLQASVATPAHVKRCNTL